MTPADIKRLRELCDKATPGPWHNNGPFEKAFEDHGWRAIAGSKFVHVARKYQQPYPQCAVDADFIAAARTALPELLDEVERLRAIEAAAEAWDENDVRAGNSSGYTARTILRGEKP